MGDINGALVFSTLAAIAIVHMVTAVVTIQEVMVQTQEEVHQGQLATMLMARQMVIKPMALQIRIMLILNHPKRTNNEATCPIHVQCDQYYFLRHLHNKYSTTHFAPALVRHLWDFSLAIWQHRNDDIHGATNDAEKDKQEKTLDAKITAAYQQPEEHTDADRIVLMPTDSYYLPNLSQIA